MLPPSFHSVFAKEENYEQPSTQNSTDVAPPLLARGATGNKDTIAVFVVRSFTQQPKQHFEIAAQGFFDPRVLPQDTSPGTRRRIAEWLGERTINNQW